MYKLWKRERRCATEKLSRFDGIEDVSLLIFIMSKDETVRKLCKCSFSAEPEPLVDLRISVEYF
jgi:hypothetical protein